MGSWEERISEPDGLPFRGRIAVYLGFVGHFPTKANNNIKWRGAEGHIIGFMREQTKINGTNIASTHTDGTTGRPRSLQPISE